MFAMPPAVRQLAAASCAQPQQSRCRKLARRALCPFINGKVIEVASSADVAALLCTVREYLPDMNLVNLTTSLHRIARLCSEMPEAKAVLRTAAHQQVLQELLSGISTALLKSEPSMNDSRRQALSNIIWSLGTLRCVQLQLVRLTASLALQQLTFFKPFELVSTVWAFAKLSTLHPDVCETVLPLQRAALEPIAAVVGKLGFRFLAQAAWALAVSGQRDQQLFDKIASRLAPAMRGAECLPEMLVDVAWAFSSAGVRNEKLLSEVAVQACRHISRFDAVEFAQLCQMLSAEGVACPGFLAAGAQQHGMLRPQVVAAPPGQWSFENSWHARGVDAAKVEAQRGTGSTAVFDEEGDCLSDAESAWSADDAAAGMLGAAPSASSADVDLGDDMACNARTASSSKDTQLEQSCVPSSSPAAKWCVKNTVLELDDEEDFTEEALAGASAIRRRLPPALDSLLVFFPREELDALRVRYQQMRDW